MANLGNIFDYQKDPNRSNYDGSKRQPPNKQMTYYVLFVLAVMLIINLVIAPAISNRRIVETSYDTFLDALSDRTVDQVELDTTTIKYTLDGNDTIYETGRINYIGEVELYN